MKFIFEGEDCIVGIIIGLLLVGLSGKYFTIPELSPILLGLIFIGSVIFSVLDIFHTFHDFAGHIFLIVLLFINNLIDIFIELGYIGYAFNFNVPYVSQIIGPYLLEPTYMFLFGAFFVVSSVFWLMVFPFMN